VSRDFFARFARLSPHPSGRIPGLSSLCSDSPPFGRVPGLSSLCSDSPPFGRVPGLSSLCSDSPPFGRVPGLSPVCPRFARTPHPSGGSPVCPRLALRTPHPADGSPVSLILRNPAPAGSFLKQGTLCGALGPGVSRKPRTGYPIEPGICSWMGAS